MAGVEEAWSAVTQPQYYEDDEVLPSHPSQGESS